MSIRETSRNLKVSRKTVSKYYRLEDSAFAELLIHQETRKRKFDQFKDEIIELYQRNKNKVYKSSIYDVLEEKYQSLPGSERTLRHYIQYLEKTGEIQTVLSKRLYTPVEQLPFGKQMQLDFGEIKISSGQKIYIFAAVLSASRYRFAAVQDRPFKTIDVLYHLLACFEYFGGIPWQIVIDQDSTLVVNENQGDIRFTKDFRDFKDEMGFSVYVCRKSDPESKGKVENHVKFIKTSFFSGRVFTNYAEIPERLDSWLSRRANGKICQATGIAPMNLIELERKHLKPLKPSIYQRDSILNREERRVSEKSMISVGASFYSVPMIFRHKSVWIFTTDTDLFIYNALNGTEIAQHRLSIIPGNRIIHKNHQRNTEHKPAVMKEQLISKLSYPVWSYFVEHNYTKYKRYFREQHESLSRYLQSGIKLDILKKAIDFCISNETWSAANLKEAYHYIHGIEEDNQSDILPNLLTGIKALKNNSHDFKVKKRSLSYYTSLVNLIGGVL